MCQSLDNSSLSQTYFQKEHLRWLSSPAPGATTIAIVQNLQGRVFYHWRCLNCKHSQFVVSFIIVFKFSTAVHPLLSCTLSPPSACHCTPRSEPLHRKLAIDIETREEHRGTVEGKRLDLYPAHILPIHKTKIKQDGALGVALFQSFLMPKTSILEPVRAVSPGLPSTQHWPAASGVSASGHAGNRGKGFISSVHIHCYCEKDKKKIHSLLTMCPHL